MYTMVFAMTLFTVSAEGNSKSKELKSIPDNFVVLNDKNEIEIERTFYHFDKKKSAQVTLDKSPMMICFHDGSEFKCEKKIAQLIDMPLLNFWSLKTKK